MPEVNIKMFATAVDIACLFAENPRTPMAVVETPHTLGLRPFLRTASVGVVIPKARPSSRGSSFGRADMALDADADGVMLGSFLDVSQLKRLLRAVHHDRRRGDMTLGEVIFNAVDDPMILYMYGPGSFAPVSSQVGWSPDGNTPRSPVYLSPGSGGPRVSPSVLKAIGQAGHKISPTTPWSFQDGRWEIQGPQGQTLRVATWPTNP